MKKYAIDGESVKLVKSLNIKDKHGDWFQIEYLTGPRKGDRGPLAKQSLDEFKKPDSLKS